MGRPRRSARATLVREVDMNSPLRPLILMAGFTLAAFGQSPRTQPYSAAEVTETVQTLADGTHITHSWTNKIYSDSERRTRTERTAPEAGSPQIISLRRASC